MGEIFRNPNLAASYRADARRGTRRLLSRSTSPRQIVAYSQANGGYLTLKDFADHASEWVEPVSTNYRGYDVWELPPNGQGIAVLEILNILEGYDLERWVRQTGLSALVHRGQEAGLCRPGQVLRRSRVSQACRSPS